MLSRSSNILPRIFLLLALALLFSNFYISNRPRLQGRVRSLLRTPFLGLIVSSTPRGSLNRQSYSLANSKLFNQPELTIYLTATRIPLVTVSIIQKSLVPASVSSRSLSSRDLGQKRRIYLISYLLYPYLQSGSIPRTLILLRNTLSPILPLLIQIATELSAFLNILQQSNLPLYKFSIQVGVLVTIEILR